MYIFCNKIPNMPSITDNFIIEVPTMQVEIFLTYLKEKLPIIKNYYYISEIKSAERISPIQIMDGINGYYTFSRFVVKLTFEGIYLPPCTCMKITSKTYNMTDKTIKIKSGKNAVEIPNVPFVPKQGSTSSIGLIDLSNDNIRLIQIDEKDIHKTIPQNIINQLNVQNLKSIIGSKKSSIEEVFDDYIKKQPIY